jgi:protein toll
MIIFLVFVAIGLGLILALYKTEIAVQLHHYLPTIFPDKHRYYKKYSAFVSFAHADRDIVKKDIIPNLETDAQSFKLCVHDRDWEVGELIPDQIIRSIQESYRTIILVTPNFLESDWCRMEFETAFINTVNERKKNIIIFFENLTVKDLDPKFQKYVSLHTYIEWGDPNFWARLKYALRHDKVNKKKFRQDY